MYRSYIAQKKFGVVLDDIKSNASNELKYVRILAEYLSSDSKKDSILADLDSQLGSLNVTNPLVILLIAIIYVNAENYETALKVLYNVDATSSLECSALAVEIYLKLDRIDLAKKEVKKMVETDEDSIITQLAVAWVSMSSVSESKCVKYSLRQFLYRKLFKGRQASRRFFHISRTVR